MNTPKKRMSRHAWLFGFLKRLSEKAPNSHPARRHTLSYRTVAGKEELVLSVAQGDDNWLVYLDQADCAKGVDDAVDDVLAFLRKKQRMAVAAARVVPPTRRAA